MQEDNFLDIGKSKIILLVLGELLPLPVFHLSVNTQNTLGTSNILRNTQRHITRSQNLTKGHRNVVD